MQRTILRAAAKEFARFGFAGARVDRIAARAKASKRMIYYYFKAKEGLFVAVLNGKLAERTHADVAPHSGVMEHLIAAQRVTLRDLDYVRLLQWEALEQPHHRDPEGIRQAVYEDLIDAVREEQARGQLPAETDPRHLALSLLGVALFPYALPQLTEMFTGQRPGSDTWLDQRDAHLRTLAATLAQTASSSA
jgi:AcrR family transcriptional regulator